MGTGLTATSAERLYRLLAAMTVAQQTGSHSTTSASGPSVPLVDSPYVAIVPEDGGWGIVLRIPPLPDAALAGLPVRDWVSVLGRCELAVSPGEVRVSGLAVWPGGMGADQPAPPQADPWTLTLEGPWPAGAEVMHGAEVAGLDPSGTVFANQEAGGRRLGPADRLGPDDLIVLVARGPNAPIAALNPVLIGSSHSPGWSAWSATIPTNPVPAVVSWFEARGVQLAAQRAHLHLVAPLPVSIGAGGAPVVTADGPLILAVDGAPPGWRPVTLTVRTHNDLITLPVATIGNPALLFLVVEPPATGLVTIGVQDPVLRPFQVVVSDSVAASTLRWLRPLRLTIGRQTIESWAAPLTVSLPHTAPRARSELLASLEISVDAPVPSVDVLLRHGEEVIRRQRSSVALVPELLRTALRDSWAIGLWTLEIDAGPAAGSVKLQLVIDSPNAKERVPTTAVRRWLFTVLPQRERPKADFPSVGARTSFANRSAALHEARLLAALRGAAWRAAGKDVFDTGKAAR